ncbi:related to DUF453 domain protein [Ramularia collo-cygni]|uniref:Related to DUF453 domain protein n=1 Tax=Ramularia collo-cygni TaxID=112498 RepID=A0A2D3V5Y6_9PEZI|nr:related to DUF453 domain protein [Ramularia collo-cygni]CZT23383.1 related to DUF453 domain protein [Ramularia collo-cygni]
MPSAVPHVVPLPEITTHLRKRKALPAVWMRAGTSKGLYLHRKDLPVQQDDWAGVITRVMGSYDSDPKQLNGIGGATSTTSKVAVVAPSKREDADVDYTFVQVALGSPKLDMTGNCGNIASGVGPFAIDEGIVEVKPGETEVQVRVFNTNTNAIVVETVKVDSDGHFLEDGDCALPGLRSTGSQVAMTFAKPAGAMTGKLLPTDRPLDTILIESPLGLLEPIAISVSMIDAANPFCFVDATTLPNFFAEKGPAASESIDFIELVRQKAAVMMGLAEDIETAALTRGTPKIAVLKEPTRRDEADVTDVEVVAYSMGKVHGSLQLTGAVCLGSAACVPGSVAYQLRSQSRVARPLKRQDSGLVVGVEKVHLRHPGGDMDVDVHLSGEGEVEGVAVFRTARRLFEGKVYYLQ